jgi:asparagine synthase (glutamine-hydrolysing)
MCGITGAIALSEKGRLYFKYVEKANHMLEKRGPDYGNIVLHPDVALGHRRLSIIDLSPEGNQPMYDTSGRYVIVYNGEIFNYKSLREELRMENVIFKTSSDTEILLELYKKYGEGFLDKLNGFFAFAICDLLTGDTFIARDRYGVKPLIVYYDADVLLFASEMKALLEYPIQRELNYESLMLYLELNYVPAPRSILKKIEKLLPGYCICINNGKVKFKQYYSLNVKEKPYNENANYKSAQDELIRLMDASVERRLIADVPVGAFLSGGIDSSVVVALASRHTKNLNTFSVGYKNDPFFDETKYANLVAKKYATNHTVFSLTQDDVFSELDNILDYIDEPFADSSALPVYVLSKYTKQHVKVALSGDGADELFGGYMKHQAEYKMRNRSATEMVVTGLGNLWKILPKSRSNFITNKFRQFNRFSEGARLNAVDRYWKWCSISDYDESLSRFQNPGAVNDKEFNSYRNNLLRFIHGGKDMNDVFLNDINLVLPNDMLTKVDLMSMANGLEVRTPFLDYTVVEWAFEIPSCYKVDKGFRKKIVQDAFRKLLPGELYNRPKKGFEVPLLRWLRTGLRARIENEWLNEEFINEQGIFSCRNLSALWSKVLSNNPEDSAAQLWAIIVFQNWWKKHFFNNI